MTISSANENQVEHQVVLVCMFIIICLLIVFCYKTPNDGYVHD